MGAGSKQRIVEVSRELFYRRGYLATSVDDILAESRVSKSNFYYHFKSKEDLGVVVLTERCGEFEARVAGTLCNPDLPPAERLGRFLERLSESKETQESGGCPFGNLVAEMADHSERFRHQLSAMFHGFAEMVAGVVKEGQERGEFRDDVSAEAVAALVVQVIQGAHLLLKCHKTRDSYVLGLGALRKLLEPI